VSDPRHALREDFSTIFMAEDGRFSAPVAKFLFGSSFSGHQASCLSAAVEDESPAVAEADAKGVMEGSGGVFRNERGSRINHGE
jgi:hypothetical protein